NMPNDNIDRAVKKATGTLDGASFEEVTYEGYGPGGTAVIVHTLTDNRNRTASEVRHAFTKYGGNLGETGCVSFMFDRKGIIVIIDENEELDEEELTLEAIEAGAEDIEKEEQVYEISTEPTDVKDVHNQIDEAEYLIAEAGVTPSPHTYSEVDEEAEEKVLQLIDMVEVSEEVRGVRANGQEAHAE